MVGSGRSGDNCRSATGQAREGRAIDCAASPTASFSWPYFFSYLGLSFETFGSSSVIFSFGLTLKNSIKRE